MVQKSGQTATKVIKLFLEMPQTDTWTVSTMYVRLCDEVMKNLSCKEKGKNMNTKDLVCEGGLVMKYAVQW